MMAVMVSGVNKYKPEGPHYTLHITVTFRYPEGRSGVKVVPPILRCPPVPCFTPRFLSTWAEKCTCKLMSCKQTHLMQANSSHASKIISCKHTHASTLTSHASKRNCILM
jgi:hypothetical protein